MAYLYGDVTGRGAFSLLAATGTRTLMTAVPAPCGSGSGTVAALCVARPRLGPNSKFFHSFSIISIFSRLYGVLNIGKKN